MAQILRVSVKGTMPGGEDWSVNPTWRFSGFETAVGATEIAAVATAVAGVAVPGGIRSAMSGGVVCTSIRVEARKITGELDELAEAPLGVGQSGTGTSYHPYQTSWVCSLVTGAVGASGRGRLYWPATGQALTASTLRPSTAAAAAFATANQGYLSAVQTAIRTVFTTATLGVWSRTRSQHYLVTGLRVGDVLDTQRRRRDSLAESYSSVTYP